MAAKPARLTTNRHGTFTLRWIVPVRLRDEHGRPKEVRISLKTRDYLQARILALEFNLALEKHKAMTLPFDPNTIAPWSLQAGGVKIEVNGAEDQKLFQQAMKDDPDLRKALMDAMRSGMQPAEAIAALVAQVKGAVGDAAGVAEPKLLLAAIKQYVGTRAVLGKNRRSTAGEKERTLELLTEHLESGGNDLARISVHDLKRSILVDFVAAYAVRQGKDDIQEIKKKKDKDKQKDGKADGKAQKSTAPDAAAQLQGLSARTVLKAVGHLHDFFIYALANDWAAVNPLDKAFDEAIAGLKTGAGQDKVSNSYGVFDDGDLTAIFDPRRYLLNNNSADDFWAPLIALYTGARLGEIVSLGIDAIEVDSDSGVYTMSIAISKANPKAKNVNSRRRVPLPSALISLGLLEYVDHVRALGATVLFPHRKANATRAADPSKHVSRVFGLHLTDIGIVGPGKVFHSFRHTVITRMHVRNVPVGDAELIVGHAAQEMHERFSSSGGRSAGQRASTHMEIYVDAAAYEDPGIKLMRRLQMHLDAALIYPIDATRLGIAARIVREHLTVKGEGATAVFGSGWHTNKRTYAEQMVGQLQEPQPTENSG